MIGVQEVSVRSGAAAPAPEVGERAKRPTGRRRGASRARQAIMDAATAQFAEHGFHAATIRGIAAAAGVDTALIRHYYGSKDDLFAATLQFAPEALSRVVAAAAGDQDHLGQRVVAAYVELWEDPTTAAPLHAAVRTAVSSTGGAKLMQEFVQNRMLPVLRPVLDDRAALRVTLASSHMLGTAISRYVLRTEPLASLDRDALIATLAPAIQRYLTGELPPTA